MLKRQTSAAKRSAEYLEGSTINPSPISWPLVQSAVCARGCPPVSLAPTSSPVKSRGRICSFQDSGARANIEFSVKRYPQKTQLDFDSFQIQVCRMDTNTSSSQQPARESQVYGEICLIKSATGCETAYPSS